MPPSKASRPTQKRSGKGAKPYSPSCPLGDSTRVNRAESSLLPSASSEEIPLAKKLQKRERPVHRELGMPSREEYAVVEAEYLASLDSRKKAKALISREMFEDIWEVLHRPYDIDIRSPQFRWWVRKMFRLAARTGTDVPDETKHKTEARSPLIVVHGGKRVAVKEDIYAILCFCHERSEHGGRDRTAAEIRKRYTWVPKELIAGFVRSCPTCICKKTGKYDKGRAMKSKEDASEIDARLAEEYDMHGDYTSLTSAGTGLELVPLCDLPAGPDLGAAPSITFQKDYQDPDCLLYPTPPLAPWYTPSGTAAPDRGSGHDPRVASGPFPGIPSALPHHLQAHGTIAACAPGHQPERNVRLPSIHTCGRALLSPADSPKITLPSLAQLLANEQMVPRQPLEALSGNTLPYQHPGFHGMPYRSQPHTSHYVPQIDPALLPDGVHMLAMVAEAAQARESYTLYTGNANAK